MKRFISFIMAAALAATVIPTLAGTLTPPGAPSGGSGMPSTAAIFQQLSSGQAATSATSFQGPTTGPGASGKSLADIQRRLPVADNTDGATAADVKAGKKFWGLRTDGAWGIKSGTLHGGYTCTGTMNGTRWCDNGNGTVRDMTTGLIWLKDASWGGSHRWLSCSYTTVFDKVSTLANGAALTGTPATLTDNSAAGDWRMPTKAELVALTTGTEAVLSGTPRAFSAVQDSWYWSSSTDASNSSSAWLVRMYDGYGYYGTKVYDYYVWPVRSGQ